MFNFFKKKENTYLDYASATPVRKEASEEVRKFSGVFGNAGSIHNHGLKAKETLDQLRQRAANTLSARKDEIIFLATATESDNLAIRGAVMAWREKNDVLPHIVTTSIEHSAVASIFKELEKEGLAEISFVSVNEHGFINLKELKGMLKENTILFSFIHANNEIGTIQNVKEIAKAIRHFKKYEKGDAKSVYPLLHTDASQSFQYLDINMNNFGVDMMTFNSSKIYGPKGVALLYVKKGTPLKPIIFGGGQEFGLRPGTPDVSGIAGFVKAMELGKKERESESIRLTELRDYLIEKLEEDFKGEIRINGPKKDRLPSNVNITVFNMEAELMVIELDAKGFSVSSKSACNETGEDESSVMTAIYPDEDARIGGVRITLGKYTSKKDLERFLNALRKILEKYKSFKMSNF